MNPHNFLEKTLNLLPLWRLMERTIPFIFFVFLFYSCQFFSEEKDFLKEEEIIEVKKRVEPPVMEYGFNTNDYTVLKDTIKWGDTFVDILQNQGVPYPKISQAIKDCKGKLNVRKIKIKEPYTILFSKDTVPEVCHFIYQPNPLQYYIVNFADSVYVEKKEYEVQIKEKVIIGTIKNTLWETITNQNLDYEIVSRLSEIYAWTVDFFKLFKNDRFKIILEEKYVNNDIYLGLNEIKAAVFEHDNKPYYAFKYTDSSSIDSYFDEKAKNLRRAFLLAPVKFTRISSRYSRRRYHPVQKRWKSHRGTDYAAPRGTPIRATADGVVSKSSYSYGNGKYVKIRHNSVYSTQYLHMSRRAVRRGQRIRQGQIIGYVGSTGLATGPHVCYRFWKNGKQVDPYKQKLPEAKPISKEIQREYLQHIAPLKTKIDSTPYSL